MNVADTVPYDQRQIAAWFPGRAICLPYRTYSAAVLRNLSLTGKTGLSNPVYVLETDEIQYLSSFRNPPK